MLNIFLGILSVLSVIAIIAFLNYLAKTTPQLFKWLVKCLVAGLGLTLLVLGLMFNRTLKSNEDFEARWHDDQRIIAEYEAYCANHGWVSDLSPEKIRRIAQAYGSEANDKVWGALEIEQRIRDQAAEDQAKREALTQAINRPFEYQSLYPKNYSYLKPVPAPRPTPGFKTLPNPSPTPAPAQPKTLYVEK